MDYFGLGRPRESLFAVTCWPLCEMNNSVLLLAFLCSFAPAAWAQSSSPGLLHYEKHFDKADVGKVPEDFLVLDGGFVVKEEDSNRFLELPGAPLDSYAVQFGPSATSNV